MNSQTNIKKTGLKSLLVVGSLLGALALSGAAPAQAATSGVLSKCSTRTVSATYSYSGWKPQNVCAENEVAVSAGGFCSNGGSDSGARMIGVSTTNGTVDRQVWLWCSQTTPAIWYAMCCDSLD